MRKHLTMILMMAALLVILCAGTVFAAGSDGYKYKVTIWPGQQGTFHGSSKAVVKEYKYGELCAINLSDLGFKMNDDSKYYVRGFRITGHDNDECTGFMNPTFNVTEDVSYELAYGIKGDMVSYQLRYVDENGKELHEPDTYYGMAGDKPAVSFRYIEGYSPKSSYNMAMTLSENESDNVFTFVYIRSGGQVRDRNTTQAAAPGTTGNPAGTNVPGANANAGRNGGNDGDGDGGDDGTTIDDNDTPLGDQPEQFTDIDDNKTPRGLQSFGQSPMAKVVAGTVALLVIVLLIIFLLKRKRDEEEEEEAELIE